MGGGVLVSFVTDATGKTPVSTFLGVLTDSVVLKKLFIAKVPFHHL